jgi:hypothetical protein
MLMNLRQAIMGAIQHHYIRFLNKQINANILITDLYQLLHLCVPNRVTFFDERFRACRTDASATSLPEAFRASI